jgi:uncharacterized membrane protein YkvI
MILYNFIFCFVNNLRLDQLSPFGRFAGSLYVTFTIVLHFFCLFNIINLVIDENNPIQLIALTGAKYEIILLLLILIWRLFWLYFNYNRINSLMQRYDRLYNIDQNKSAILFLLVFVLPFILSLLFTFLNVRKNLNF